MAVGRLRHYLTLETSTPTIGGYNEDEEAYTPGPDVWASIKPLSGKEFEIAQTINASISCQIRVRNMIGITDNIKASDRFVSTSTDVVYNIHSARRFMETADTWVDCLCSIDENPPENP